MSHRDVPCCFSGGSNVRADDHDITERCDPAGQASRDCGTAKRGVGAEWHPARTTSPATPIARDLGIVLGLAGSSSVRRGTLELIASAMLRGQWRAASSACTGKGEPRLSARRPSRIDGAPRASARQTCGTCADKNGEPKYRILSPPTSIQRASFSTHNVTHPALAFACRPQVLVISPLGRRRDAWDFGRH